MKKGFLLFMMIVISYFGVTKVNAVVDTGGGNVSEITTENALQESTQSSDDDIFESITGNYVPNVKAENFFAKIYKKLGQVDNFAQRVVAYLLIICFVVCLFLLVGSCFVNKKAIPQYAIALLIICIAFVCDLYAVQILGAFTHWAVS